MATGSSIPSCVPKDAVSQAAYHHAQTQLHPVILAHSLRVYLYSSAFSKVDLSSLPQFTPTTGSEIFATDTQLLDEQSIFLASIFHDMGTCAAHDHAQRFEACGADAAVDFMQAHGVVDKVVLREVWTAIALHTSPGLAERMSALTRVIRLGPKTDFGHEGYRALLGEEFVKAAEEEFPRGNPAKVLGDIVAGQAEARERAERDAKAPAVSWPWNLLRCRLEEPEWEGVNKGF
ncbi:hypothetical protein WHR41_06327 [Cladosporium halotolerans]|uniref:HD domain-containing protein n=1 Tax=Cladosporium halotolerans TaxID=1052096 RepID=A0AB34KI26_9PEZI